MFHHMLLFLDYIFLLVTTFFAIIIDRFHEAIFTEDVMDWCMGLLQDLSVFQVALESLNVIILA